MAGESAAAEARAAGAALVAVEAGIALYAERRDYLKLKDIAEASDVAGKVRTTLSACYDMRILDKAQQMVSGARSAGPLS